MLGDIIEQEEQTLSSESWCSSGISSQPHFPSMDIIPQFWHTSPRSSFIPMSLTPTAPTVVIPGSCPIFVPNLGSIGSPNISTKVFSKFFFMVLNIFDR